MLAGRRVVLGVSGGIACYKSCTIARRLAEAGAEVDVVLTRSAAEFIRPLTFEALTGRPVHTSLWDPDRSLAHIRLARDPDLIVLAPATANLLARAAQGLADDLLAAVLLAADRPIIAAPAMNDHMFQHPATQANLKTLRSRGWTIVGPGVGALAEGPSDRRGRMAEPEEILAYVVRALRSAGSKLRGKRVVVTAGPTREPLDGVRVITNPSSGRMGYAIAAAAFARGADVTLVTGPGTLPAPYGVDLVPVETTEDMLAQVSKALRRADALIMAAAPADFRRRGAIKGKQPRQSGDVTVTLVPTPDILVDTRRRRKKGAVIVGFALEVGKDVERRARRKLEEKSLDLVVLNRGDEPGSGFGTSTNRVTLITAREARRLPRMSKAEVAERVLDEVEARV